MKVREAFKMLLVFFQKHSTRNILFESDKQIFVKVGHIYKGKKGKYCINIDIQQLLLLDEKNYTFDRDQINCTLIIQKLKKEHNGISHALLVPASDPHFYTKKIKEYEDKINNIDDLKLTLEEIAMLSS